MSTKGAPGTARTCGPQVRSLVLYPTELRTRAGGSSSCSATSKGPRPPDTDIVDARQSHLHRCVPNLVVATVQDRRKGFVNIPLGSQGAVMKSGTPRGRAPVGVARRCSRVRARPP